MITKRFKHLLVLALAAAAAACTVSNTEPPPLSGPSEMSLSLSITANPDVLSLDGASQSQITIEARDENGQLAANVPLRVEIVADGQSVDFGTISARTLVTGSNGRATFTYTAPPSAPGSDVPSLSLSVTPTGTDASSHVRRMVSIRLVPPGIIAIGPTARFTFLPSNPAAFSSVRFDGSTSTAGLGSSITGYVWDFGDGTSGTGVTASHQYTVEGIYVAKLTVSDSNGLANQTSQALTVGAGAKPTADFVFSPSSPGVGDTIFFNGTVSTAGTGHRIVRYDWDFGSGSRRSGATVTKVYDTPSTYAVVLTVTDEVGQTAQAIKPVTVGAPAPTEAKFTFSPTDPGPGDSVNFNASTSTTAEGNTITSYHWDFGDGSSTTTTIATTAHTYAAVGTYVVTLRITDSDGVSDLETQTVAVE